MSSVSSYSVSSKSNISDNNTFSSKLRRLKIQESVLSTNVNKSFLLNSEENNGYGIFNNNTVQLKKYISKLKNNLHELKQLFEEITLQTNDQETFENTDIDEVKKNIMELETKIRNMKQFIIDELQALKNEEMTLMQKPEASETSSNEERKLIRHSASQRKGYNEIVPSPIRVIINSPFKCAEVQQFQDFMKKSPNRYGGWNEYNHNIFVQIWNKYYEDNNIMIAVKSIEDSFSYQDFKEEVLQKISGTSLDSIDSHSKWYSEYLNLKMNQQKALNKWRENKRKIRPTQKARPIQNESAVNNKIRSSSDGSVLNRSLDNGRNQTLSDIFTESTVDSNKIYRKLNSLNNMTETSTSVKDKDLDKKTKVTKLDIIRLQKPTKQSLIKQESEKEIYKCINNGVENISKLGIPTWRMNLRQ